VLQISHSEIACFRQCKRRWFIIYVLGFSPDPAKASPVGATQLGTRVHLALQAYYAYGLDPLAVLRWDYQDVIDNRPFDEPELAEEMEYALAMVEGYLEWVAEEGIDDGFEIIDSEKELQAGIITADGDKVVLRGKLDQIVRRKFDDVLLCRDFKTVGTLQKADSLVLGTQLRHYALLQSLIAPEEERVEGGIFVMLRRVKRGGGSKPPFYAIESVHLNQQDMRSYWFHVREIAGEMIRARRRLEDGESHQSVVYANPTDACNWICPARLQCPLFDDGSRWQDALQGHFVKRDPYAYYSDNRIDQVLTAFGVAAPKSVVLPQAQADGLSVADAGILGTQLPLW
jgi:hypothetical protein